MFLVGLFIFIGEALWEQYDNRVLYPKRQAEYNQRKKELLGHD